MLRTKKIKAFIAAVVLGVFVTAVASPAFGSNDDDDCQGDDNGVCCVIIQIAPFDFDWECRRC